MRRERAGEGKRGARGVRFAVGLLLALALVATGTRAGAEGDWGETEEPPVDVRFDVPDLTPPGTEADPLWGSVPDTPPTSPEARETRRPEPPSRVVAPTPPEPPVGPVRWYRVRDGDLLVDLAERFYGESMAYPAILTANPRLKPRRMGPGLWIKIPERAGKHVLQVNLQRETPPRVRHSGGRTLSSPPPATGEYRYYRIQDGDILQRIARRFYGNGDYWLAIKKANPGLNQKRLRVRAWIKIPKLRGIDFPDDRDLLRRAGSGPPPGRARVTDRYRWYQVAPNDTYGGISQKLYGTMIYYQELMRANPNIGEYALRPDPPQWIRVPELEGIDIQIRDLRAVRPGSSRPTAPGGSAGPARLVNFPREASYEIKPGDTLQKISKRHYGRYDRWLHIRDANPGIDPHALDPGEVIRIPALVED